MPIRFSLVVISSLLVFGLSLAQSQQTERQRQAPFQSIFVVRGVEFSEEQQQRVDELQQKYTPQLVELQRKLNSVYTAEQRRAFQGALRAAKDSGKDVNEARASADEAAKISHKQKMQLSTTQKERSDLTVNIQKELRSLLTAQQRVAFGRNQQGQNNQRRIAPTHPDVKYGPHARHLMDVWLAKSDKPTAVLVSIHGGGFRGGNKSVDPGLLRECLDAGISVAAITYRLSDVAIAPAQFHDAARAVQFIRHNAKEWNIDSTRMAATGGSAGAGLSLWLGFHNDLADPDNDDPVLRQSTRLKCMAVYNGQTSYDPRFIRDLFPGTDTYKHPALPKLYGVDFENLDDLPDEKYRLFEEVSALPHLSKDDVPVLLMYASEVDAKITSQGIGIHHPRFGKALKEKMDPLGIECRVETGVRRGDDSFTKFTLAFVRKHLAAKPVVHENVTYRKVGDTELQLDIAQPVGHGPFPAIVFIHGGGWYQGNRLGYRSQIEEAARRGYVAATISYRLMKFDEAKKETTTATPNFPAQIHDAKAAIRWLRANAKKYHVDPDRIGVTGGSAGGHLSLLVGLTDPESNLEGDGDHLEQSSRVQAVVNVFGPTDMAACHDSSVVAWIFRLFMGGTPDEATDTYTAASPMTYVSEDDPPVLTLHGDQDTLVPVAQATMLDEKMKAAGAVHKLIILEGQGHGFGGEPAQKAAAATWEFFEQHLKP